MSARVCPIPSPRLDADQREDLQYAATLMGGAERRRFEAAMALKYGGGQPRRAEAIFG